MKHTTKLDPIGKAQRVNAIARKCLEHAEACLQSASYTAESLGTNKIQRKRIRADVSEATYWANELSKAADEIVDVLAKVETRKQHK